MQTWIARSVFVRAHELGSHNHNHNHNHNSHYFIHSLYVIFRHSNPMQPNKNNQESSQMHSIAKHLFMHEQTKRIVHCPRRAKALLDGIDFSFERNILGLPHIAETKSGCEGESNSNNMHAPILTPRPARMPHTSENTLMSINMKSMTVSSGSNVASEIRKTVFRFDEFEAPLDPWEALQNDMSELKTVLK